MTDTRLGCGVMVGIVLFFMLLGVVVGAWLWPYSLNSWLVYFGKAPQIQWWHGALLGICPGLGQACIPVAVITWILMLVLA